uniref:beta-N-acetylhexosaminidase n=1 Tax=Steinernema glaseri TaxID=37863 RepID=A0A1I7ZZF8_9BILA
MEYEDMFPYGGDLAVLAKPNAYSVEDVHEICKLAQQSGLSVIPLVQTFGHLEFALKHERFAHLREEPAKSDTICPSDARSYELVQEMLKQVFRVHSEVLNLTTIHIGADEAWSIAKDERCQQRLVSHLHNSTDRLKLEHIASVAHFAKDQLGIRRVLVWNDIVAHFAKDQLGIRRVLVWNDMFDKIEASLLSEYKLPELVVPNVWGYVPDVTREGYFPAGMFHRYQVFQSLMFAGAFKGANGVDQNFISMKRYLDNLYSYVELHKENEGLIGDRLSGMILTGWQRYNHHMPLCELLPVGIPTLVSELLYLNGDCTSDQDSIVRETLRFLNCQKTSLPDPVQYFNYTYQPPVDSLFSDCDFPGKDIFKEVEKLRTVAWKIETFTEKQLSTVKEEILAEINDIERRITPHLNNYFYGVDVHEWLGTNLHKYRLLEERGPE